jgi:hypothetical protein
MADAAAAIGVHEGPDLVVVDHPGGDAERVLPADDLDAHVGALADGDAALEALGRDLDDELVGLPVRLPRDSRDRPATGGPSPGKVMVLG